jgi:hypothetical protein
MRMRHPKVAGEADVPESAVGIHRMSGWLTDEEWAAAGLPEPEPEPDGEDDSDDGPDDARKDKPRRVRRAPSKEGEA